MSKYPVEDIPNDDRLFLRAHKGHFIKGEWRPGVIRDQGSAMSVDWEKYSTAEEARQRARVPDDNGVVSFQANAARDLKLDVLHDPLPNNEDPESDNRAHSAVHGMKSTKIRVQLRRALREDIPLVIPEA